jgi:hypothetical protein
MISARQHPRLNDTTNSMMTRLPAATPFYLRVTCTQEWTAYWLDTVEVTGSIPTSPTSVSTDQRLDSSRCVSLSPRNGPTVCRVTAVEEWRLGHQLCPYERPRQPISLLFAQSHGCRQRLIGSSKPSELAVVKAR